jgi:hypothetical protein
MAIENGKKPAKTTQSASRAKWRSDKSIGQIRTVIFF